MREGNAKAIGWLLLVTSTALFASALFRQEVDVWADSELLKNRQPTPLARAVLELYGPAEDEDTVAGAVACSQ